MRAINARLNLKLLPAAILLLAVLVFLPSLGGGLVGWDDRILTESARNHDLTPGSIFRMFVPQRGFDSSYQPLRTLSFRVTHALAGDNPAAYLALNLLLYLANIALFYLLAAMLAGTEWRHTPVSALAAAALFAVHPVHVEVVSWHQGSKMTLMGAFFLLALICYLHFRRGGGARFYWMCLAAYLAALLSQPSAVALPLVLAAWELVQGRGEGTDTHRRIWLRLAPFFLPAAALAGQLLFLSTVRIDTVGGAALFERLAFLPVVWGKSLLKLLLPVNLCARYPLAVPADPDIVAILGWTIFIAACGWATLRLSSDRRSGWFALLFFSVSILPTSGLAATSTLLADRYLYLPGMALFLAAGMGFARLISARPAAWRYAAGAAVLVCLAAVSLVRQYDWRDRVSLWNRVVEVYPRHSLAQFNLADAWSARGERVKAIEHYSLAIDIDPNYGDAYANLSTLMLSEGRTALAGQLIAKAVNLRPDRAEVWIKQGIVQAATGDDSSAAESFSRAIRIDDGWAWAGHFNLGTLYLGRGEYLTAGDHLRQALGLAEKQQIPASTIAAIRGAIDGIPKTGEK